MTMAATKKKEAIDIQEWMYEIIRNPVVTEKSAMGSAYGQVTFRVPLSASKPKIKTAVETLFKVKVTAVNTSVQKGKTKRFRASIGKRNDVKKAIVTLAEGQTIDVGTGL